jgi:thiol-disulfide isomerase/thioredoxin
LLAQGVVASFGGRARFVSENYGDSALAKRFGVTRYPAIFVEDVLVATPKDFGWFGKGEGDEKGRYAPLKNAASHARFQSDLTRMIELTLAGKKEAARAVAAPIQSGDIAQMPAFSVTGLDGKPITKAALAGKVVLVEFWATWCPPCRGTLGWLGELKKRHGDRIEVVALAVESDEANVRKLVGELDLPLKWAMASPEMGRAFGDIGAVPTLFLFDREGKTVAAFFGAPPTLHKEAETKLAAALRQK